GGVEALEVAEDLDRVAVGEIDFAEAGADVALDHDVAADHHAALGEDGVVDLFGEFEVHLDGALDGVADVAVGGVDAAVDPGGVEGFGGGDGGGEEVGGCGVGAVVGGALVVGAAVVGGGVVGVGGERVGREGDGEVGRAGAGGDGADDEAGAGEV